MAIFLQSARTKAATYTRSGSGSEQGYASGSWAMSKQVILNAAKFFAVLLLCAAVFSVFGMRHAAALTPDDIPNDVRPNITSYDTSPTSSCLAGNDYSYYPWISQPGNPTNDYPTAINVPYGTSVSLPLQYYDLVFLCHVIVNANGATYPGLPRDGMPTTNALTDSSAYIDNVNATSGTITNSPAGQTMTEDYNGATRYWFANPVNLTYNSPVLTSSETVTITINVTRTNNFHNGADKVCVAPGGVYNANDPPTFGCPETPVVFYLTLNVEQQVPQITITSGPTCNLNSTGSTSSVTFTAEDPGNPNGDPVDVESVTHVANPNNSNTDSATRSSQNGTSYTYDTSLWDGYQGETFTITASDQAGTSTRNFVLPPCATFTCSGLTPTTVTNNQQYPVNATFSTVGLNADGAPPGGTPTITYTVTGDTTSPSTPAALTVSPYNSVSVTSGNFQGTGMFTVTSGTTFDPSASMSYPGLAAVNCSQVTGSIGTRPFMQVYGGDTLAGGGFTPNCTADDRHAEILGNTYLPPPDVAEQDLLGAGGSLANLALSDIDQYYSDGTAGDGSSLTLANVGPTLNHALGGGATTDYFGGDYYAGAPCAANYDTPAGQQLTPGTIDVSSLADTPANPDGNYYVNGDVTLSGATIGAGQYITLYVSGSVEITGDISYAASGWTAANIPMLRVVSAGDIYIDGDVNATDDVSTLYGTYIAQGGTIYTCTNSASKTFPSDSICDQHLNVYGAFVADQVDFMRTWGNAAQGLPVTSQVPTSSTPETLSGPGGAQASAWEAYGSATPGAQPTEEDLTENNVQNEAGAFYTNTQNGIANTELTNLSFDISLTGDPSQGIEGTSDGMAVYFNSTEPTTVGDNGCALGNSGTDAGIIFDAFLNDPDTGFQWGNGISNNFMASVEGMDQDYYPSGAPVALNDDCHWVYQNSDTNIPQLASGTTIPVDVTFSGGKATNVCLDTTDCMAIDLTLPSNTFIGFTGSNGESTATDVVSNIVVSYTVTTYKTVINDDCDTPDPQAGETFCYDPALWLASPAGGLAKPQSIDSLPPIL